MRTHKYLAPLMVLVVLGCSNPMEVVDEATPLPKPADQSWVGYSVPDVVFFNKKWGAPESLTATVYLVESKNQDCDYRRAILELKRPESALREQFYGFVGNLNPPTLRGHTFYLFWC